MGTFVSKWATYGGGLSGWRKAVKELGFNYSYVFTGYSENSDLAWSFIKLGEYVDKVNLLQYELYKKLTSTLK
jgi:hypothetical protein